MELVNERTRRLTPRARPADPQEDARRGMDDHLHQLVTRGALDFADERSWESSSTNLRVVDRFNELNAYAYCCATRTRFVLLTDARADENVRAFFSDVHEAYAVALMNPMLDANAPLGASFGDAVRLAARRLGARR